MKNGVLLAVMALFSIFCSKANASMEGDFWKWFQKNDELIYNFESDQEIIFDKLSTALGRVDPNLTFEFSPIQHDGSREFVISAAGIKDSFPSVEALVDSAPSLERWTIVKFRPRRSPLNDLTYGGVSIKVDSVSYNLYKDADKLGIVLFFDNYNEAEHTTYATFGYLFLDEALGEYDVETKLSFIEFHNKESSHFEDSKPLRQLSTQFDDYFGN